MKFFSKIAFALCLLGLSQLHGADIPVTFQPSPADGKDAWISRGLDSAFESNTYNHGAEEVLRVGQNGTEGDYRRSLLRFDLSTLPANAIVQSATLTLTGVGGVNVPVEAYRLKLDWDEGANSGTAGTVNWNFRTETLNWPDGYTGTNYPSAGGLNADAAELSAPLMAGTLNAAGTTAFPLAANRVQAWFDGRTPNLGLLIRAPGEATPNKEVIVASSDATDAATRPKLSIVYRLAPTISGLSANSGPVGTPVTITGTNFDPLPAGNVVTFGGIRAQVLAATTTSLDVIVPTGTASGRVSVSTNGLVATSPAAFIVSFASALRVDESSFAPAYETPYLGQRSSRIADIDRDGRPDLVIIDSNSRVLFYRNIGASGTVDGTTFDLTAGIDTYANGGVVVADFDGDGRPDIFCAGPDGVMLRNTSTPGAISFEQMASPQHFNENYYILTADVEHDGRLDLIYVFQDSRYFQIYKNTTVAGGAITFDAPLDVSVDAYLYGATMGDLNGDGLPEMVIATYGGDRQNLLVFPNTSTNGKISFGTRLRLSNNLDSAKVTLGDIDGDGKLDVVLSSYPNDVGQILQAASVLRNTGSNGSISFAAKVDVATSSGVDDLLLEDIDGDGVLDLLASCGGTINLFRNRSTPGTILLDDRITIAGSSQFGYPGGFGTADVDGDGRPDFYTSRNGGTQIFRNTSLPRPAITSLSRTSGVPGSTLVIAGALFSASPTDNVVYFGAVRAQVIEAASGRLSVVIPDGATYGPVTVTVGGLTGVSAQPFVPKFLSAKTIDSTSFGTRRDFALGGSPVREAMGDFDGDGKPDVVSATGTEGTIIVSRNTSPLGSITAGSFAAPVTFAVGSDANAVAVSDIDGDGKLDILIVGGNGLRVFRNLSAAPGTIDAMTFAAPEIFAANLANPRDLVAADLDNDGRPDVIATNGDTDLVTVLRNSSAPGVLHFAAVQTFQTYPAVLNLAVGDIDGDGLLDLAVTNGYAYGPSVRFFRNVSTKGRINLAYAMDLYPAGAAAGIALADLDGDGKADLITTNPGTARLTVARSVAKSGMINAGTFPTTVEFPTAPNPQRFALGDLDGDGRLDVAVVCAGAPGRIWLYHNTATPGEITTASLGARMDLAAGNNPTDVSIVDLDADAKPEVVISVHGLAALGVFKNNVPIVSGPVFQFSSSVLSAADGNPSVSLTVERNFAAPATVTYTTVEGTAKAGLDFTAATGTLVFAEGETTKTFLIGLVDDDAFERDETFSVTLSAPTNASLGTPATATVIITDDDFFEVNDSVLDLRHPDAAPPTDGSLKISFSPAQTGGQWRLLGEPFWRNDGDTVTGMVAGNYVVEYKPVPGFTPPPRETVPIMSAAIALARPYTDEGAVQRLGSLKVTLKPDEVAHAATAEAKGQWRREGEVDWRDSEETVGNLAAGAYIVEFKDVPGRSTPPRQSVLVPAVGTGTLTRTYFVADPETGAAPTPLDISTARDYAPYQFVGQIETDSGFGTGFVVRDRTVLTAAHVLFDDSALTSATGILWSLQKSRGQFEAPPQVPRGFYVFRGYAAQRQEDNSPGTSSPASQNLDVAALFFQEPAARRGYGGFLRSDLSPNEWLTTSRSKILIGYPITGVPETDRGRMHATPAADLTFTQVYPDGRIYATTDVHSFGGNSGGPLCVQHPNGNYYPAGIYLGGTAQTLIRAIDSLVVDLINRAQNSGNSGGNNTNLGALLVNSGLAGPATSLGSITININPAAARLAQAGWRIVGESDFRASGLAKLGLPAGEYTVEYKPVAGFLKPPNKKLTIDAGGTRQDAGNYSPDNRPEIKSVLILTKFLGSMLDYDIVASNNPESFAAGPLPPAITRSGHKLQGKLTKEGTFLINLGATNAVGTGTAVLKLKVLGLPGELTVNTSGAGTLTPADFLGTSVRTIGKSYTLTAVPAPGFVFAGFSGGITSSSRTLTFPMTAGLELTANFVPSPFISLAGSYAGLKLGGSPNDAIFVSLTLDRVGGFTGRLNVGNKVSPLKGTLDVQGAYTQAASATAPTIALKLNTANPTDLLEVTVYIGGAGKPLLAERAFYDGKDNVAPQAAKYTAIFPRLAQPGLPEGSGYATATVDGAGKVTLTGALGDATPITFSGRLTKDGVLPLFLPPVPGKSGVVGQVAFHPVDNQSDFDSSLQWAKNGAAPVAFHTTVPLYGSKYTPPPVDYTSATAKFGGAGVTAFQKRFTIANPGFTVPTTSTFSLKLTNATGLFSGTVTQPTVNTVRKFNGVLFQKTRRGDGLFKATAPKTGYIEITP